jgi:hypothetical protein
LTPLAATSALSPNVLSRVFDMADVSSTNNLKAFQATLLDYQNWNKRSMSEIVNQKLYFIALRAMQDTKTTTKQQITEELNQPSDKYPDKTLGEILTLKDLQKRGKMPKRGKTLAKNMANYVQRFINKRASHTQFLRSGWIPAVKKLDYWNKKGDTNSITFSKRFAPKKPAGIKQFGKDKGDVKPAPLNSYGATCRGTIFNFIGQGKQKGNRTQEILQSGLDKAVAEEIHSMKMYMERKWQEEHRRRQAKGELKTF